MAGRGVVVWVRIRDAWVLGGHDAGVVWAFDTSPGRRAGVCGWPGLVSGSTPGPLGCKCDTTKGGMGWRNQGGNALANQDGCSGRTNRSGIPAVVGDDSVGGDVCGMRLRGRDRGGNWRLVASGGSGCVWSNYSSISANDW